MGKPLAESMLWQVTIPNLLVCVFSKQPFCCVTVSASPMLFLARKKIDCLLKGSHTAFQYHAGAKTRSSIQPDHLVIRPFCFATLSEITTIIIIIIIKLKIRAGIDGEIKFKMADKHRRDKKNVDKVRKIKLHNYHTVQALNLIILVLEK